MKKPKKTKKRNANTQVKNSIVNRKKGVIVEEDVESDNEVPAAVPEAVGQEAEESLEKVEAVQIPQ